MTYVWIRDSPDRFNLYQNKEKGIANIQVCSSSFGVLWFSSIHSSPFKSGIEAKNSVEKKLAIVSANNKKELNTTLDSVTKAYKNKRKVNKNTPHECARDFKK